MMKINENVSKVLQTVTKTQNENCIPQKSLDLTEKRRKSSKYTPWWDNINPTKNQNTKNDKRKTEQSLPPTQISVTIYQNQFCTLFDASGSMSKSIFCHSVDVIICVIDKTFKLSYFWLNLLPQLPSLFRIKEKSTRFGGSNICCFGNAPKRFRMVFFSLVQQEEKKGIVWKLNVFWMKLTMKIRLKHSNNIPTKAFRNCQFDTWLSMAFFRSLSVCEWVCD